MESIADLPTTTDEVQGTEISSLQLIPYLSPVTLWSFPAAIANLPTATDEVQGTEISSLQLIPYLSPVTYWSSLAAIADLPTTTDEVQGTEISSPQFTSLPSPSSQEYPSELIGNGCMDETAPGLYAPVAEANCTTGHASGRAAAHTAPKQGVDVAKLPKEILPWIFRNFIAADCEPNGDNLNPATPLTSYSCRADPTVLGLICSRWRTEAIGMNELWYRILIYNPKWSQVELVKIWLERSGKNPLHLAINYDGEVGNFDFKAASHILKHFSSHLQYWTHIEFLMPVRFWGVIFGMVSLSYTEPLLLESATVGFCDEPLPSYLPGGDAIMDDIYNFFYRSRNLCRVTCFDNFPRHAPFTQLTRVQTHFTVFIHEVLAFLAVVPRIEEIFIDNPGIQLQSETRSDIGTPSVLVEHLRVLEVTSVTIQIHSLFESLTCPSLQRLAIKHPTCLTHQPNHYLLELNQFLQRSDCQLQALKVVDLDSDDVMLTELFTTLKSLTSLWTSESYRILLMVMRNHEDTYQPLLPRLRKLYFDLHTADGLKLEEVMTYHKTYLTWTCAPSSYGTEIDKFRSQAG